MKEADLGGALGYLMSQILTVFPPKFPLDLCVPSRALQGNYTCMLDKTSKNLVKLQYLCREEGHF